MISIVFGITLAAEILAAFSVLASIIHPRRRIWPPNQSRSIGQIWMLVLFCLAGGGAVVLGVLDWGHFTVTVWLRLAVGIPFWLGGSLLALWAMMTLGVAATSGEAGAFVRSGPYAFSRNPQYLGFSLGLIGWALVCDSAWTLGVALVGIIPLWLVPFAEEPWLLERHGAVYAEYQRAVPRFFRFVKL
jgi:protein-S-isoprenylcysteine O-methyltransferase Ste14